MPSSCRYVDERHPREPTRSSPFRLVAGTIPDSSNLMAQPSEKRGDLKPLSSCACIVAVSDPFYMKSLREILGNMGFGGIETCRDGSQVIFMLQQRPTFDLVVAQEDLPITNCIEIVNFVRADKKWIRQELPIISIGWKWTHEKIESYRNSGVDDIIVFPTSQFAIQKRVLIALYSERKQAFQNSSRKNGQGG